MMEKKMETVGRRAKALRLEVQAMRRELSEQKTLPEHSEEE